MPLSKITLMVPARDRGTGDMPLTFMRYFYLGANLRALMDEMKWPDTPQYRAMKTAYLDAVRDTVRGTRLADFRPFDVDGPGVPTMLPSTWDERKVVDLSRDVYRALLTRVCALDGDIFASLFASLEDRRPRLPPGVQHVPSFDHHSVTYATFLSSRHNSFVLFDQTEGPQEFPGAGKIKDIFLHGRMVQGKAVIEPFFVVDQYVPLTPEHAAVDPYRRFVDLQTRLFYNRATTDLKILALKDIRCHFAALTYAPDEISEECIVVRSLDRVSERLI